MNYVISLYIDYIDLLGQGMKDSNIRGKKKKNSMVLRNIFELVGEHKH